MSDIAKKTFPVALTIKEIADLILLLEKIISAMVRSSASMTPEGMLYLNDLRQLRARLANQRVEPMDFCRN